MKSEYRTWSTKVAGDDIQAMADEARGQAAKALEKDAIEAEVQQFHFYATPKEIDHKWELLLSVRYRVEVPFIQWIESATKSIRAESGPGTLEIEPTKVKV